MEGAKAAALHNSDLQYQECVKTLEEARVLWDRETGVSLPGIPLV